MKDNKSKVKYILRLMKELNINQRPCEEAHFNADRYLVTLIKHLGPNSLLIKEIISEYESVCKWYGYESDE